MKKSAGIALLCVAMVCGTPTKLSAQVSSEEFPQAYQRSVPDTAWESLTKPPAFSYRNLREGYKPPKPSKPYKRSLVERIILGIIGFFSTAVGKFLLWSVLIGVLVYGVWMAFFNGNRFSFGGKKKAATEEDPTEEDLHSTSWLRLMEEALSSGDTRLAIRYGYLHVLQVLSDAARVEYRPGKTNADYIAELAGGPLVTDFRALSRSYEYTWYGSYPITPSALADFRARMGDVENRSRA